MRTDSRFAPSIQAPPFLEFLPTPLLLHMDAAETIQREAIIDIACDRVFTKYTGTSTRAAQNMHEDFS